jgi:hypothetical protein
MVRDGRRGVIGAARAGAEAKKQDKTDNGPSGVRFYGKRALGGQDACGVAALHLDLYALPVFLYLPFAGSAYSLGR